MTGERRHLLQQPATQPGGREPAPGELVLVQAFLNTHFDLEQNWGADLFEDRSALKRWLRARNLVRQATPVDHRDVARALAIRGALRDFARANGDGHGVRKADAIARLNEAGGGTQIEVHFAAGGPRFRSPRHSGVDGALGLVLATAATAMIDGSWRRLKICPGHDCDWAFYDHSRNQTGRWCSMSICGSRAKARAHYHRQRGAER
jgi:predicted RNA-binding Zn ribbon-like protein